MSDPLIVLGIAPQYSAPRLSVALALVKGDADGGIDLLAPWRGASAAALSQQLFDFYERLVTTIDSHGPTILAVRRPESNRGATAAHDAKVSVMALALLAARQHRLDAIDLRSNQLKPRHDDPTVLSSIPTGTAAAGDPGGAIAAGLTVLAARI